MRFDSLQRGVDNKDRQRQMIASNLVELSNIEYLLKMVNFVQPDPDDLFVKCLKAVEMSEIRTYSQKTKNKNILMIPYNEFSLQQVIQKQERISQIISKQVNTSVSISPQLQILSRQQLLNMGNSKIRQHKIREQQQLLRSRRSFQYIQQLRQKITTSIQTDEQILPQQQKMELQQIITTLEKLQQQRNQLKMQLYYLQKQTQQIIQKIQLYQLFQHNLSHSRKLYTLYLTQPQIPSMTKYHLLSSKQLMSKTKSTFNHKRNNQVDKIQKFLNAILLDQREIQLLKTQLNQQITSSSLGDRQQQFKIKQ